MIKTFYYRLSDGLDFNKTKRKLTSEKKKRLDRIELTLVAWKATVLPLNYRRKIDSHNVSIAPCFLQIFSYSKNL